MIEAYKKFWKGYVDFKGRSTPSDLWSAYLAHLLIVFAGNWLEAVFESMVDEISSGLFAISVILFLIIIVFCIAAVLPCIAIAVRRLRDAGYHWAFIFLYAGPILLMWVPFLNILGALAMLPCSIALIVLLCMPTKEVKTSTVHQGQFTTQQAQPQQQPVQAQQFTQPQEQAVEPETTPTQPQQESATTTETPEQVVQSDEKELDSAISEDN